MKHDLSLKYKDIDVRPLSSDECELLRELRNENKEYFFSSGEISCEQQANWYRNYLEKENDYVFSVYCSDIWIGSASLYNIKNDEGEFGRIVIDGKRVNKNGLGTQAVEAVCRIGFDRLGLKRISLEVLSDNKRAIRAYEKAGFQFIEENVSDGINITLMQIFDKGEDHYVDPGIKTQISR